MKTITIGRNLDNQIIIDDMTVSRNHAKIEVDDNGKIFITDFSQNGTYVNGQRLFRDLRKQISRGDQVSFANVANLDWSKIPSATSYATVVNPPSPPPPVIQNNYQKSYEPKPKQIDYEPLDFLKLVVSFIVPLYGIILYFIHVNSSPKKSSQAITAALIGLGVGVIFLMSKK